ncbi:D-serine deaminase, pyridoxal phosphate-dependent [Mycobacterium sp. 88mf]|nr:D-serine deaminase, pyridoxal phosphate-dependent [Mycobacterium sp. 88mf]SFF05732.1 D-serine deaminase, pyridoxal phosphate-dependent [Mycobacterium sp. 455mf]
MALKSLANNGTGAGAAPPDNLFKGLPSGSTLKNPLPVCALSAGFMWPMAVISDPALRNNAALMSEVCARYGVQHAPHLKTSMSPELAELQADEGAWGFTVGSSSQVRTVRSWGWRRIVLAAECVDAQFLRWLGCELEADPTFEFYLFIDSVAGAQVAAQYLGNVGVRAGILLDVGHSGGRTGVRDDDSALAVARAIADLELSLAGIAGYEGTVGAERTPAVTSAVSAYLRRLRATAELLDRNGMFDPRRESFIVSCGGSTFFDLVVDELSRYWTLTRPVTTVLRSGCYLLHDHDFYASSAPTFPWGGRLQPALEVWAQVISRPEPGLAILNSGRRDIGFDLGLPIPLRIIDPSSTVHSITAGTITELNDQHAYLTIPAAQQLSVGDLVALGLSHPCTTMDKWRAIPVIDDELQVIDYVRTHF